MNRRALVIVGLAALLASATQASQEQLARSIRDKMEKALSPEAK